MILYDPASITSYISHCFRDKRISVENRQFFPPLCIYTPHCSRALTTSYWRFMVTMALSRIVSEIINVENVVTLKSGSELGHSRSSNVIPFDTVYGFLLVFTVTLSVRCAAFEIFDLWVYSDLETRFGVTQGHRNRHGSIRRLWLPISVP